MQAQYDEQHEMLADTLSRFVANEYDFETRDAIANAEPGYSLAHWQQLADIGIVAALFDEAAGGLGGSGTDIALIFECLGRGIVVEPFLAALLGGHCLVHGNATQRAMLEGVIAGERLVSLGHTEADSGYALQSVTTRATKDGEGWVIDGTKVAVPHGGVADDIVVSARSSGDAADALGISLFVVPGDADGVSRNPYVDVDGGTSADIRLKGVRLNQDALVGEPGDALPILSAAVDRGMLALSAEALGVMAVTSDLTLQYLRDRRQFGVSIGSFQALQHRMVDVYIAIEQARSAVQNAVTAMDSGDADTARTISAAKYTSSRTGRHVAEEAIQLHGGNGMTWEVPVSHYAKRLVMNGHQLGDEDFHLQRYIELAATG